MQEKSIFNSNYIKIIDYLDKAKDEGVNLYEKINIKESIFLKHIKNLRKANFKIVKNKELYRLDNYSNDFILSDVEESFLAHIMTLANIYLDKKNASLIEKTVNKILHLSEEKTKDNVYKKFYRYKKIELYSLYDEKLRILNNCIRKKEKIKAIMHSQKIVEFIPKKLIWINNSIYISYFDELKEEKKLSIEKIIKIIEKNEKYNYQEKLENETFFELYGRLKNCYLLKDNERIVDNFQDRIVIASSEKNKNMLFQRLLRYDILCRVILPKKDVEDFKKLITTSINNLSNTSIETIKERINL